MKSADSKSNDYFRIIFWSVLGLLVIVTGSRLAVIMSPTKSRAELVVQKWRDASVGKFTFVTDVSRLDTEEQARFLLNEIDRILAAEPNSAQAHMGAALILDCPTFAFLGKHSKGRGSIAQQQIQAFEEACGENVLRWLLAQPT